ELLADFKRKDPVGYLLMARLDQSFGEEGMRPELVFSWTVYEAAQLFVRDHGGVIDEQAERDWERMIIASLNGYKGSFPSKSEELLQTMGETGKTRVFGSAEERKIFVTEAISFIEAYPLEMNTFKLAGLMLEDEQFREDGELKEALNRIIRKFPDEPTVAALGALVSEAEGNGEGAIEWYKRAVEAASLCRFDADDKGFYIGLVKSYASCLLSSGFYEDAESYLMRASHLSDGNAVSVVEQAELYLKWGRIRSFLEAIANLDSSDYPSLDQIVRLIEENGRERFVEKLRRLEGEPSLTMARERISQILGGIEGNEKEISEIRLIFRM
ncbi:MAG: hypothetical protein Q7S00_01780, partial [bacterium]|nr:hypothetical protein [bacterium]